MWGTYPATVPKSIKPQEPSLKGHSNRVNTIVLLLHKAFGEKNEWVNKQIKVNTIVVLHTAAGEKKEREEGREEEGRKRDIISTHCLEKRATMPDR